MKKYTVAELRSKTREILNEALFEPVIITRYDEEFFLQKKQGGEPKTIKNPADIPAGVAVPGACAHGAAPGFCKVSSCKNSKRV